MKDVFSRFWMNKGAGPSSVTFATFAEAEKEASRLAGKEGRDIYVMEMVAVVRPAAPPTVTIKLTGGEE